jgi:hypothetical protein
MNRNDVIDVLTAVAAATRRTVGQADVEIWEGVIGGDDVTLALKAVRDHLRDRPGVWLEPGHVHQRVRAYVRDSLERESDAEREGRQNALAAKVRDRVDALASGKAIPSEPAKYVRRGDGQNPLNVPCSYCRATVGRPCVNGATGQPLRESSAHPTRVERFNAQMGARA